MQSTKATSECHNAPAVFDDEASSDKDRWRDGLIEEIRELFAGKSETMLEDIHEQVDGVLFEFVLRQTEGNISQASKRLGISRPTLRNRLRQLRLGS